MDHIDGFSIFNIDTHRNLGTFCPDGSRNIPTRTVPKQAAFAHDGARIVTGSTSGRIFVYNRLSPRPEAILEHLVTEGNGGGCVETVTVSTGINVRKNKADVLEG
jgi:hypothetical protein